MGDTAMLTEGAIFVITTGTEDKLRNYTPVVQILNIRRMEDEHNKVTYHLLISDGKRSFLAFILGPEYNKLDMKDITEYALIKLKNYKRSRIDHEKIAILLQKLDVVRKGHEVGKKLGNPQPFFDNTHMWSQLHVEVGIFAERKFDGSGEKEPGLVRVKADIRKLQKALQAIRDNQDIPEISKLIQQAILDYEQSKVMNCSNYKEIRVEIADIVQQYHYIFASYFIHDKVYWRAYEDAVNQVRFMLGQAQNRGYPGLPDDVLPEEDYWYFRSSKGPQPNEDYLGMINSLHKKVKATGGFQCVSCYKTFADWDDESLDENGVTRRYPCTKPTLINISPRHEIELQIVCTVRCDKIRVTKEAELLRNDGIRITKRDLKWNLCQVCYQEKKLQKCGQCHMAYYCSETCQEKHWPYHKDKCIELKKLNDLLTSKLSTRTSGDIKSLEKQMDCNVSPEAF